MQSGQDLRPFSIHQPPSPAAAATTTDPTTIAPRGLPLPFAESAATLGCSCATSVPDVLGASSKGVRVLSAGVAAAGVAAAPLDRSRAGLLDAVAPALAERVTLVVAERVFVVGVGVADRVGVAVFVGFAVVLDGFGVGFGVGLAVVLLGVGLGASTTGGLAPGGVRGSLTERYRQPSALPCFGW